MPGSSTYQVRSGDTLSSIAFEHGTTVEELIQLNHLQDPDLIYTDQVLRIESTRGSVRPSSQATSGHRAPSTLPTGNTPGDPTRRVLVPEDFLSPTKGSQSLAAIVIGNAEGTRMPRGGMTVACVGHLDPGNGKRNLGSFSYQVDGDRLKAALGNDWKKVEAASRLLATVDKVLVLKEGRQHLQELLNGRPGKTPPGKELSTLLKEISFEQMLELINKADQAQLGLMRAQLSTYVNMAKWKGLDPSNALLQATFFDSFNQSPAASKRFLKQFDFLKNQPDGITVKNLVSARVRSWIDPSTSKLYGVFDSKHQWKEYGGGFKNIAKRNKTTLEQCIRDDQERRVQSMVTAFEHQGLLTPSVSGKGPQPPRPERPRETPQPTAAHPSGPNESPPLTSTGAALPPLLPDVASGRWVLAPGREDKGKETTVAALQTLLELARPQWAGKLKQERGVFGAETRRAVIELQKAADLSSAMGFVGSSTLEFLKYEVYSSYFQARGITLDSTPNKRVLLGLRVPTSTQVNKGEGVYDDRVVMLWHDKEGRKRLKEFLANTDPAGSYLRRGYGANVDGKNGKELGRLKDGYYKYEKSKGYTGWLQGKNVLRSKGSVSVEYDVNHDGGFDEKDKVKGKNKFTTAEILFHAGSRDKISSAGCQTMPPEVFTRFWTALEGQKEISYLLVTLSGGTSSTSSPRIPVASADGTVPQKGQSTAGTTGSSVRPARVQEGKKPGSPKGSGSIIGDVVERHVIYPHEVRVQGTLAWRNNNPGNIRNGFFADSHGAFRGKQNHGFAVFPDRATGFAALQALLRSNTYKPLTVVKAMERYAPAKDKNDPAAYARSVAKMTGLSVERRLSELSDQEVTRFAKAIERVEGRTPGVIYTWNDSRLPMSVRRHLEKGPGTPQQQAQPPTKGPATDKPIPKSTSSTLAESLVDQYISWMDSDEAGLAQALYAKGNDVQLVTGVFDRLQHTAGGGDADDVAVEYVQLVKARRGPPLEMLKQKAALRERLVGILDPETPFDDELQAVRFLQSLSPVSPREQGPVKPQAPASSKAKNTLLAEVLLTAASQLDVREEPRNSNRGPMVDKYLRAAGLNPIGQKYPWCCAFVYWCFNTTAKARGQKNPMVKTAGCLDHWRQAGERGIRRITASSARANPSQLKPGMILIIDYGEGLGHTGLIESIDGDILHTIEGNTEPKTQGREGGGVYRLSRNVKAINRGFIDYSAP